MKPPEGRLQNTEVSCITEASCISKASRITQASCIAQESCVTEASCITEVSCICLKICTKSPGGIFDLQSSNKPENIQTLNVFPRLYFHTSASRDFCIAATSVLHYTSVRYDAFVPYYIPGFRSRLRRLDLKTPSNVAELEVHVAVAMYDTSASKHCCIAGTSVLYYSSVMYDG